MTGISRDIALSISNIIKNSKSESTMQSTVRFVKLFNDYLASLSLEIEIPWRVSKKAKTDVASKLIQGEDTSTQLSLPLPIVPGVSNDPVSNDSVSNDPVSTDQMCEPVGKSDAPHNNKLSLNKTSNTTKYNSPTKIKGGITNSNKNVAITITGGSCNFYL
ncbi:hypothetical protein ACTFIR_002692 [Dictyostelium discoideum]